MNITFIGTSDIAVPSLQALIASEHNVLAVVTQPDKGSGRGRSVKFSPVKETAVNAEIPVMQPEKVGEDSVLDELEQLQPDLFVVVSYAQKLPKRLLEMGKYGCINVHPSLLPKYRGAGPLIGPILNGDEVTGVTIMEMADRLDAGDILAQEEFPLDPKETVSSLEEKAAAKGAEMLLKVIAGLEAGTIVPQPQNEAEHTYMKQISKEAGRIDFSKPAVEIERMIRALNPWPTAYTSLEGKTFKLWDANVIPDSAEQEKPGTVIATGKNLLTVKCGDGCLQLKEVQMEGKKRMAIADFLRGKKIEVGTVFGE
ncbi:MAG: methionyl-tRNA formyltransferase [Lachnospiraceae bacterium]|nr:methionyl-tRNA formyltransferase [Lachnospiraceae bacterium]